MEKKKKKDQGKRYEKIWRKEEKWDFFFFLTSNISSSIISSFTSTGPC